MLYTTDCTYIYLWLPHDWLSGSHLPYMFLEHSDPLPVSLPPQKDITFLIVNMWHNLWLCT